jgi:hypothetical protein
MDEDLRELIVTMCARSGMIMEDASLLAVTMSTNNPAATKLALARLGASIETSRQLIIAATMLQNLTEWPAPSTGEISSTSIKSSPI